MKKLLISTVLIGVVISAVPASAQLLRVGPTVPANGFPAWYQDKTGIALEFCQPLNQAELDGGWCLLLPADTVVPEVFPSRFADEHFYWAGESTIGFTAGGVTSNALLVLGIEAAFAAGGVVSGDQVVFARIRIRINSLPFSGTYTVYHPYGVKVFENQVAGGRLFDTDDIGIACTGQFDCALLGHVGPFLLPSATPGGAELAAVPGPVPGKAYIADPARVGPVTGSPVGQNLFRIEGPNGFVIQSNNFGLMGRVFTGVIPGKVTVDRASYSSLADAVQPHKLDVFASAFPTAQTRLPAAPAPPAVQPVLAFYPDACVASATGALAPPSGVAGVQMFNAGTNYYGQTQPDVIPPAVCVGDLTARDINGQIVPLFSEATVTDQVTITEAAYDPANGGSLSVKAVSSDEVIRPALDVLGYGPMVAGGVSVTPLAAPPSKVRVASAKGGVVDLLVTTMTGPAGGGGIPAAVNDAATMLEDAGQIFVDVLANDSLDGVPIGSGAATVTIVGQAHLGTAALATTGEISYTPGANRFGSDLIAYTVTVNGRTSPAASVAITITPVNDAPVAVNDTATVIANASVAINVLANDVDLDGAADLVNAEIASAPAGATATVGAGGVITFAAAAAGTHTFTYRAIDGAGARSAAATVTVNVTGNETITITRADFVRSSLRWRVSGTTSVLAGQTITIAYDNGTLRPLGSSLVGFVIGTAVVDATGAWDLDLRLTSATDPRNPDSANTFVIRPNRIRATSPLGGRATAAIALK